MNYSFALPSALQGTMMQLMGSLESRNEEFSAVVAYNRQCQRLWDVAEVSGLYMAVPIYLYLFHAACRLYIIIRTIHFARTL